MAHKVTFMLHTRWMILILLLVLVNHGTDVNSPSLEIDIKPSLVLGQDYRVIECYAQNEDVPFYSKAPDLKEILAKGGGTLGDFEVRYTGFTQEAREAFQFAVDIWDMLLDSPAKIVINANFTELGSGVLGSAAPTGYFRNFDDKADPDVDYAGPVAEKIAGRTLNGNSADLSCNFNNVFNWSFDYLNPQSIQSGQYDFVSVVLHELGHGLGFLSRHTFADAQRRGFIRGDRPEITDIFSLLLEDFFGENLFLNYEEASSELGISLTGNSLNFNSHTISDKPLPRIYAPNPWDSGSSLSHLDEVIHSGVNGLMTPSIGAMEIQHNPGLSLSMLYDMGWSSTFISHEPNNRELLGEDISISADIATDIGMDTMSVKLIYSMDTFSINTDTLPMIWLPGTSNFTTNLPQVTETTKYQYFIAINDSINQRLKHPRLAKKVYHEIFVGEDIVAPVISHQPFELFFLDDDLPELTANVVDEFMGVQDVKIEYKVKDGPIETILLTSDPDVNAAYSGTLNFETRGLMEGDIISYRIIANDKAIANNVALLPSEGWYEINIKSVPNAVDYYFNDFNQTSEDFKSQSFSIRTEDGFTDGAMHSPHPYINAGTGNELNFVVQLRIPIKILSRNATIEFDEIVLVEPGEAGNSFGDEEFWDYVVVEASKDNGTSWIPLADGYDSSDQSIWRNRYDTGISGQNSTSAGDSQLFVRRSMDLYNAALGFSTGDEVLIRWRLFSDPFATGWGWTFDNLEIQKPVTTAISVLDTEDNDIHIYPNPVVGHQLHFDIKGTDPVNEIEIYDSSGRLRVIKTKVNLTRGSSNVDISQLGSGSFYALFRIKDTWITKPFLKVQ